MPCSSRTGFLMLLTTLFVATTNSVSNNNNISTDQSSLAALKLYVTSDPKNFLKNGWSDSTFVCNWTGVTCGTEPLRVVGLNLSYAGLVGTVPPHLGNLTSLTELLLTNNSFHGVVPNELSRLSQLNYINFVYNDMSGEIPSWLGSLPKLQALRFYRNRFSGSVPSAIFNSTSLQIIDLSYNKLSGSIPTEVSNATSLKTLDLFGNHLSGKIPAEISRIELELLQVSGEALKGPLPQFVFNMSSLKVLALSHTSFYGTLPRNLCQHLPKIEELYLVKDNLSGQIPSTLSECKQLSILSLDRNNFQGTIPKTIANLTRATEIYLNENKLTGTIPVDIGNLGKLRIIDLKFNHISGTIPPTLFNISTIKAIGLYSNQLSGGLPPNFGMWVPNLEEVYLGRNKLSGSLPESISNASKLTRLEIVSNHFSGFIPNTLRDLNKMEYLSLANNSLTLTESTDNFLYGIANLSHLKVLAMHYNPLSTTLPTSLGSNISMSLERLYLYNCNLRGPIPSSFANFINLIALSLAGNELSGQIPPSLGMLQKLQALDLSHNMLDGPVPLELCQLRSMSGLYFHSNMLSGSIPWCFGNIASLKQLYLASNKFSSTIPPAIWGLVDILEVDLSSNSLTGSLSIDIGNLKVLTYFDVSNNKLSGSLSSTIGDLKALTYLYLSNNSFQGPIPDSMGDLLSLQDLDFSKNNLSGLIPKSLEKLSYLKFLNLSYNKLYGEIPSGGPFSSFSAQSFIHNENLCGASRLQVPPCKSAPRKANKGLILRCVIPSVIVAITLFIMILIAIAFCRKKSRKPDSEASLVTLRRVSQFELSTATNGFKAENLLGIGSFGSVYKGMLSDGLVVAVKVFNLQLEEAFETFSSECEVLCNVRHRNLLKVLTCCNSPDFKALVLQYMPHGSLDKWLYSDGLFLNLFQRLNIMIDVALALEYLHYGYSTPIVHCDLKPSNVLLDENMVAHVSDFGIAKLLCGEDSMTQTMTMATIGYMAPEYGVGGVVSRRGDVYSFGIMLMEVLTKKKPIDDMFCEEMSLKQWVQNSIQNVIYEVVDVGLLMPEDSDYLDNKDCVTSILELALDCSASSPEERIDMKVAVSKLNKIKKRFFSNMDD